ncbi:LuxR C-terminal-related transcriptional regulator [Dyadobacter psychrotolerans]|uniref:Response regulator transcription factor n=1 Tax=Dyadobacter psychrotolerans TaxID=2541721 RepID=A0A4R5DAC5_9BACT|nr:LuxR C-terminal-related transcriptional regulator [Dyadobacter psychrotolerans]TDE08394.1 response regulator transcription factor [Dyadobacter psychrotolerans]
MVTLAIIDPFPVVRLGVRIIISQNFKDINILDVDSFLLLSTLHPKTIPDIIIIGLGTERTLFYVKIIHDIRVRFPYTRIIVIDRCIQVQQVKRYMEAGVIGFVSLQTDVGCLVACFERVLNGNRSIFVTDAVDYGKREVISQKQIRTILLTQWEREIAECLCDGLKPSHIADIAGKSRSSISAIKNRIFQKLEINNIRELVELMRP